MNIKHYLSLCFIALALCVGAQTKQMESFSYVKDQFQQPAAEYGSAPLWVWNTKVSKQHIDQMLQEFKDKSFGGVFVHPRPGLVTEYLSPEWMELWRYSMEKAKSLGMEIWIYDENSYPTGFAGGYVPAEMPESFNQGQVVGQEQKTSLDGTENAWMVLKKNTDGSYKDISATWKSEVGKTGDYLVYQKSNYGVSPWYAGYSYVDLMVPGVTEKFLDITMRRAYEKDFKQEFGKTIKGIFSDEPNIAIGGDKMRWTPLLFPTFQKQWGYKLENHLPSLFGEVGDYKRIRHNYRQTLLYLFIEYWSKPMNKYTNENKLEWTGHYWEHGWPNPNDGPDNMAMYAWHQRPAIDMLFNQFDEVSSTAQFGNIRAVKELASVANQMGVKRTLSETYGGAGWELTFKDMKRLGDWEYVLGVNTMNQHISPMTLEGVRKYDYPPTFTYHNTWWNHYGALNQYFNRLSLALSNGKQRNNILVLEPTSTAWFYFVGSEYREQVAQMGNNFQAFVTQLEKNQVEYDLGSEDIIKDHGSVVNKRFVVGKAAYSTIVIPPGMENINHPTYELLAKFKKDGGTILFFEAPQYIDGRKDKRLAELMKNAPQWPKGQGLNADILGSHFKSDQVQFHNTAFGHLYHHRREFTDGQLLFLTNASMEQAEQGSLSIKGADVMELDLFTGKTYSYPKEALANGSIKLDYELPPAGSCLLYVSKQQLPQQAQRSEPYVGIEMATSPLTIKREMPNVLTVDFCDISFGDQVLKEQYFDDASNALFRYHGFADGNPWCTSVQFKDNTVRRDHFANGTGFTVDYHFTLAQTEGLSELRAVVERCHLWEVYINGQLVKPQTGAWWLDHDFSVFDLAGKLKTGENTLTLKAPKMSVFAEVEPIYIIGNFSLQAQPKSWALAAAKPLRLGSWKEQGIPLYGHDVSYTKTFNTSGLTSHKVVLGQWKGTVAVLKVNGQEAAVLLGNETSCDITQFVKSGDNTVELVVTGSLKNTLGPFYRKSDGLVTPWHWRGVKAMIPGMQYDLMDYGLMEDFKVVGNFSGINVHVIE